MRKVTELTSVGILIVGVLPAWTQQCPTSAAIFLAPIHCAQVQYHGGPVLENWTIYPLYYGNWTQDQINTQQAYLQNLAAYISGDFAPAGQQPILWQYGPRKATVAPATWVNQTTSANQYVSPQQCGSPAGQLLDCDVQYIIGANQGTGPNQVPNFGPERVIVLFPAPGFSNTPCNCGGYHWSESDSAFYAVVYYATGPSNPSGPYLDANSYYQAVTSHEIQEDATDPATGSFFAWVTVSCNTPQASSGLCLSSPTQDQIFTGNLDKEVADQCDTVVTLPNGHNGTLQVASIVDNTLNGACSTTGYMPQSEHVSYQMTLGTFQTQSDTEFDLGYQLYIVQSYVTNGNVLYDAVWRPQATGTTAAGGPATGNYLADQLVDAEYSVGTGYTDRFTSLEASGWRLHYLQTLVQNGSPMYYNAVWRKGTEVINTDEYGAFGQTEKKFRSEYEANFPFPNQWRLYDLQEASSDWIDAVWHNPDGPSYSHSNNNPATPCNCSDELHIYQGTFAQFSADYAAIQPQGWRISLLDPYVRSDGTLLYNAIWRSTRTYAEDTFYKQTFEDYQTEYTNESGKGFYLYILSVYVLPGDHVRYDAVFRQGMFNRPL